MNSMAPDQARMHATPVAGVTLMHAHFVRHAFDRHSHETYSIGVTQAGVQSFRCRGSALASVPGSIMAFLPDEPHDGHAGVAQGFAYRMLYLDTDVVTEWLQGAPAFREPLIEDAQAAARLTRAMDALLQPGEALRAHALLSESVIDLGARHARGGGAGDHRRGTPAWITRVRDLIEAHHAQDLTVETLAEVAGVSRVHVTRAFGARYGLPPHLYLNAARLRHARRLLLEGDSLADAAAAAGFADQSHFTRRFKGSFGMTPGAWLQAVLSRPR